MIAKKMIHKDDIKSIDILHPICPACDCKDELIKVEHESKRWYEGNAFFCNRCNVKFNCENGSLLDLN